MLASALAKFTDNSAKDQIPTAAVKTLRNASTGKAVLGNEGVNKIMLEIAASFKKDGSSKAAADVNPLEQLDARTNKFFLELQHAEEKPDIPTCHNNLVQTMKREMAPAQNAAYKKSGHKGMKVSRELCVKTKKKEIETTMIKYENTKNRQIDRLLLAAWGI